MDKHEKLLEVVFISAVSLDFSQCIRAVTVHAQNNYWCQNCSYDQVQCMC